MAAASSAHLPKDRLQPFLFIVACGRSGTTLLRSMFDSHPAIAIPGESGFILRRRKQYERGTGFACDVFVGDLLTHPRFQKWGIDRALLEDCLTRPPVRSYADAIRRLYGLYAGMQSKERYGDKTPAYVLKIPELADLFPEARFIHIVRDGRDVALSYMDVKEWGPNRFSECATYWKRRVMQGRRDGSKLGPARYREVAYEHLIADPEGTLRSLCEFSELDFDNRMLRYHERASEVLKLELQPHRHQGLHRPPTKRMRDWRQEMQPGDIRLFETLAGDALSDLGYDRRYGVPDLRMRARGVREVYGLRMRRVSSMIRAARRRISVFRASGMVAKKGRVA